MKASEVIARLQELIEQEGDLDVGVLETEFGGYLGIYRVFPKDGQHANKMSDDDEELGDRFIALFPDMPAIFDLLDD